MGSGQLPPPGRQEQLINAYLAAAAAAGGLLGSGVPINPNATAAAAAATDTIRNQLQHPIPQSPVRILPGQPAGGSILPPNTGGASNGERSLPLLQSQQSESTNERYPNSGVDDQFDPEHDNRSSSETVPNTPGGDVANSLQWSQQSEQAAVAEEDQAVVHEEEDTSQSHNNESTSELPNENRSAFTDPSTAVTLFEVMLSEQLQQNDHVPGQDPDDEEESWQRSNYSIAADETETHQDGTSQHEQEEQTQNNDTLITRFQPDDPPARTFPVASSQTSIASEDVAAILRALSIDETERASMEETNQQASSTANWTNPQAEQQPTSNVARLPVPQQFDFQDGSYTDEDIEAIQRVLNSESNAFGGGQWSFSSTAAYQDSAERQQQHERTTPRHEESKHGTRPKFASATVLKPTSKTELGLTLKTMHDGSIKIEHVATNGFLFVCGAPLKAGDELICIKSDKGCAPCGSHVGGFEKHEITKLLRKAAGMITIIVQHADGNPERVESMTSKPHPEFGTGIFFVSGASEWRGLQIHSVPDNGLFAHSLLHKHDKVISINGVDCTNLDASVATDIVKSAPRYVNIITQTTTANLMNSIHSTADDPAALLRTLPDSQR